MLDDFTIGAIDASSCTANTLTESLSSNRNAFWFNDGLIRGKIAKDSGPGVKLTKLLTKYIGEDRLGELGLEKRIREIVYTCAFKTLDFTAIDRCISRAFQNGLTAGRSEVRHKLREALGL